jgi:hypothetical protein
VSSGPLATTVNCTEARSALESVVPRLVALIRSIRNPSAPALGEWNTGDVALHLAHVWEALPALSRGALASPIRDPRELSELTSSLVRDEPSRDLGQIAARIEAGAATYLATPAGNGEVRRPWLVEGTALPESAFACHLLNESLVHGYDIARAERSPWRIDPAHAAMAVFGFTLQALSVVDPRFPVDQQAAAGVHACYDIRVRRTGRFFLVFDDGALSIEPPSSRSVDWRISADPTALFLTLWSRRSPWPAMLTGGLRVWGRHPLVGLRLTKMLRNP